MEVVDGRHLPDAGVADENHLEEVICGDGQTLRGGRAAAGRRTVIVVGTRHGEGRTGDRQRAWGV